MRSPNNTNPEKLVRWWRLRRNSWHPQRWVIKRFTPEQQTNMAKYYDRIEAVLKEP